MKTIFQIPISGNTFLLEVKGLETGSFLFFSCIPVMYYVKKVFILAVLVKHNGVVVIFKTSVFYLIKAGMDWAIS